MVNTCEGFSMEHIGEATSNGDSRMRMRLYHVHWFLIMITMIDLRNHAHGGMVSMARPPCGPVIFTINYSIYIYIDWLKLGQLKIPKDESSHVPWSDMISLGQLRMATWPCHGLRLRLLETKKCARDAFPLVSKTRALCSLTIGASMTSCPWRFSFGLCQCRHRQANAQMLTWWWNAAKGCSWTYPAPFSDILE